MQEADDKIEISAVTDMKAHNEPTKSSNASIEPAAPDARGKAVGSADKEAEKPKDIKKKYTANDLLGMTDIDFDELLECADENIENTAFFASSSQVLSILDSTIAAIDDRLLKKRSKIISKREPASSRRGIKV